MHPLMHVWAGDRLSEELQKQYWAMSGSILAASIPWEDRPINYRFQRTVAPHIESCISLCRDGPFISGDSKSSRANIAKEFASIYFWNGRHENARELLVKALEVQRRFYGEEDLRIISV